MKQEEKQKLTPIESLGEFGLIDHLTLNNVSQNPETLKGVGDDAALIQSGDKLLIATKDLLLEGVHFDLVYTPLKHLGYKAIAVNLSDVYAMNGHPKQVMVGLGVSSRFSLEALEEIYQGMYLACNKYGVDLVGGDTTASQSGLVLSVTALGLVERSKAVYRNGSKPNDLLCVSGNLGAAYCGLLVLQREKAEFKANPKFQPDLKDYDYVLERQLKPEPRQDIIKKLEDAGVVPTSMIDVSDGLASEALHLCKNSGNSILIYEEHIPIDNQTLAVANEFKINPTVCALSGGEDYELLFTISQSDHEKIKNIEGVSIIGHVAEGLVVPAMVTASGQQVPLTAQGWDALKN